MNIQYDPRDGSASVTLTAVDAYGPHAALVKLSADDLRNLFPYANAEYRRWLKSPRTGVVTDAAK